MLKPLASLPQKKLQLGDSGLGAGAKPEVGKEAAENEIEQIKEFLKGHTWFYHCRYGGWHRYWSGSNNPWQLKK